MTSDVASPVGSEMLQPVETKRGRWWAWLFRRRVAIPLFLIALVLLAPTLVRGYRLSLVPDVPEPFDTDAVLHAVVPDEQNAFVEYRQAMDRLVALSNEEKDASEKALASAWADVPEAVRRWVDDNRHVLDLWKEGTTKPDAQLIRADQLDSKTTIPIANLQALRQLVLLNAKRLAADGNPEQAWELLRCGLRTGHHFGLRGGMLERSAGLSISWAASEEIVRWAQDSDVTTEMLRRAQKEIDEVQLLKPPLSAALQREYLMMRETIKSASNSGILSRVSGGSSIPVIGTLSLYTLGELALCERCLKHAFGNYLGQVDKPRHERTKQTGLYYCFEPDPKSAPNDPTAAQVNSWMERSPLGRFIMPRPQAVLVYADQVDAMTCLMKVALAL